MARLLLLSSTFIILSISAHAHDYHHPELDQWYQSLRRPGHVMGWGGGDGSCCSKKDCHRTEAEIREDGKWWARLGIPHEDVSGEREWELGPYVKVPDDIIVKDEKGLPVRNPEGEAVICHSQALGLDGNTDWGQMLLFCFVPGQES